MVPEDTILISTEAARFLRISEQKLNRLRRAGIIQGVPLNQGDPRLFAYQQSHLQSIDPTLLQPQKRGPKPRLPKKGNN